MSLSIECVEDLNRVPMVHGKKAIPPDFVKKILSPYKSLGTDYLCNASVTQLGVFSEDEQGRDEDTVGEVKPIITMRGSFSIPSSCYIQSTGHFNAVEFLICYNQLAYTTYGHLFSEGILAKLPPGRITDACKGKIEKITIDQFFSKQLSSMFILRAETRFKRVIDAENFNAELTVDSVIYRSGVLFTNTKCHFTDSKGGSADGTVVLAYPINAALAEA
jgi:hypothetical protein